jgi:hypothetical protein
LSGLLKEGGHPVFQQAVRVSVPGSYRGVNHFVEAWITVPPGSFTIFFPDDAHAPMGAEIGCEFLKAVMKVAVDWR